MSDLKSQDLPQDQILAAGPSAGSSSVAASGKAPSSTFVESITASQLQTMISELFRLQLYRNDDYKLIQSSVLKQLQTSAASSTAASTQTQANSTSGITTTLPMG